MPDVIARSDRTVGNAVIDDFTREKIPHDDVSIVDTGRERSPAHAAERRLIQ